MNFNLHFNKSKEELKEEIKEELVEGAVESVNEVVETRKVDVILITALGLSVCACIKCMAMKHEIRSLEKQVDTLEKRVWRCESKF